MKVSIVFKNIIKKRSLLRTCVCTYVHMCVHLLLGGQVNGWGWSCKTFLVYSHLSYDLKGWVARQEEEVGRKDRKAEDRETVKCNGYEDEIIWKTKR